MKRLFAAGIIGPRPVTREAVIRMRRAGGARVANIVNLDRYRPEHARQDVAYMFRTVDTHSDTVRGE